MPNTPTTTDKTTLNPSPSIYPNLPTTELSYEATTELPTDPPEATKAHTPPPKSPDYSETDSQSNDTSLDSLKTQH